MPKESFSSNSDESDVGRLISGAESPFKSFMDVLIVHIRIPADAMLMSVSLSTDYNIEKFSVSIRVGETFVELANSPFGPQEEVDLPRDVLYDEIILTIYRDITQPDAYMQVTVDIKACTKATTTARTTAEQGTTARATSRAPETKPTAQATTLAPSTRATPPATTTAPGTTISPGRCEEGTSKEVFGRDEIEDVATLYSSDIAGTNDEISAFEPTGLSLLPSGEVFLEFDFTQPVTVMAVQLTVENVASVVVEGREPGSVDFKQLTSRRTTKQGNAESLTIPVPAQKVSKLRLVFRPVSNDVVVVKGLEIEVCLEKPATTAAATTAAPGTTARATSKGPETKPTAPATTLAPSTRVTPPATTTAPGTTISPGPTTAAATTAAPGTTARASSRAPETKPTAPATTLAPSTRATPPATTTAPGTTISPGRCEEGTSKDVFGRDEIEDVATLYSSDIAGTNDEISAFEPTGLSLLPSGEVFLEFDFTQPVTVMAVQLTVENVASVVVEGREPGSVDFKQLTSRRTTKQGNAESLTIPVPAQKVSKLRLVFRPVSNDVVVVKGLEIEVCLEKPATTAAATTAAPGTTARATSRAPETKPTAPATTLAPSTRATPPATTTAPGTTISPGRCEEGTSKEVFGRDKIEDVATLHSSDIAGTNDEISAFEPTGLSLLPSGEVFLEIDFTQPVTVMAVQLTVENVASVVVEGREPESVDFKQLTSRRTTKQGNAESLTIPIPAQKVSKLRLVFKPVSNDVVVVKGLEIEVCLEKPATTAAATTAAPGTTARATSRAPETKPTAPATTLAPSTRATPPATTTAPGTTISPGRCEEGTSKDVFGRDEIEDVATLYSSDIAGTNDEISAFEPTGLSLLPSGEVFLEFDFTQPVTVMAVQLTVENVASVVVEGREPGSVDFKQLTSRRTTKQGNAESLTIPVPAQKVSKLRLVFRPVSNDVVVVKGLEIEVCLEKPATTAAATTAAPGTTARATSRAPETKPTAPATTLAPSTRVTPPATTTAPGTTISPGPTSTVATGTTSPTTTAVILPTFLETTGSTIPTTGSITATTWSTLPPGKCLFDMYQVINMLGQTSPNAIPWIEKDGEKGPTSENEYVETGDVIDEGVVINISCDICLCSEGDLTCEKKGCEECVYTQWSDWSQCSEECDVGSRNRTREPIGVTFVCNDKLIDYEDCNIKNCIITTPTWTTWTPWNPCTAKLPCEVGTQIRGRTCLDGDSCEGDSTETRGCFSLDECEEPRCANGMVWDNCSNPCQETCMNIRMGSCVEQEECVPACVCAEDMVMDDQGNCVPMEACSCYTADGVPVLPNNPMDSSSECEECICGMDGEKICTHIPACHECVYSDWTDWGDCHTPCGDGDKSRYRQLEKGTPEDCLEPLVESTPCQKPECPPLCNIGDKGYNFQETTREDDCMKCICGMDGTEKCTNKMDAVVDGGWSDWTNWTTCTKPCSSGKQYSYRLCNNPVPKCGGELCDGLNTVAQTCNDDIPCCEVGPWSNWTDCSKSCDSGIQTRTAEFLDERSYEYCDISVLREERPCNTEPCNATCIVSDWEESPCSETCGAGYLTRRRTIINDAEDCVNFPLIESLPCEVEPCIHECGENMVFEKYSLCYNQTCQSRTENVYPKCMEIPLDGCVCKEGYFREGDHCVTEKKCDICMVDGWEKQNGEVWTNGCDYCQCVYGLTVCQPKCEVPKCAADEELSYEEDQCCPKCQKQIDTCSLKTVTETLSDANCTTDGPVEFNYCSGGCGISMMMPTLGYYHQSCRCCIGEFQEFKTVPVKCGPEGKQTMSTATIPIFSGCKCNKCIQTEGRGEEGQEIMRRK
ncbi:hypothetical protein CHS0354_017303 [Potamilus streckersoni]|uniref:SCO-spondin n=1 Tax=Potamilus streckersoni TaxID=2493646 RepID=A0AAE0T4Z1_9BIVA|nr:hypothetical protein CHS0354_017303 [Potamilus streckersoni]